VLTARDATDDDLPAILAIYNDVILTTDAVWADDPVGLDDRRAWLELRHSLGYPVLVAADDTGNGDDTVLGFASFGDFRSFPGYRRTVEHSIHVTASARGRGIGSILLPVLIERARALGKHVMVGAIDGRNDGSVRFHERFGFQLVGRMPQIGMKGGRWLDLVLVQRRLDDAPMP
jgi:L-amino acid N-acyltransferase